MTNALKRKSLGIVSKIFGLKARFCNGGCRDSFREDRKVGLIYGPYRFSNGSWAMNWEEASFKDEFCAYCGKDLENYG